MGTGLSIEPHKQRHYGRWLLALVVILAMLVSGYYVYQWYMTGMTPPIPIPVAKADPTVDESDIPQSEIDQYTVPAEEPKYISIDTLGVEKTRVFPVGTNDQNLLESPRNIHDAAWYKKSVTPGHGYGAVLINAHSGGISKNGIFTKLSTLKQGDEITVERGDGKLFRYSVIENQTMDLDEVNATGMKMMMQSAEPGSEGLNLITCAGKWVPSLGQFDQRVMLRAIAIE